MADIFSRTNRHAVDRSDAASPEDALPAASDEAELIAYIELLFFAYRDFIGDPDAILEEFGFGRAHHRVLHFVCRQPGLRVADLLEILKITKQSLARVLKQLIVEGYIVQEAGELDRRERLLYATEKGEALFRKLMAPQLDRVRRALDASGPDGPELVEKFLLAMVRRAEQEDIRAALALQHAGGGVKGHATGASAAPRSDEGMEG